MSEASNHSSLSGNSFVTKLLKKYPSSDIDVVTNATDPTQLTADIEQIFINVGESINFVAIPQPSDVIFMQEMIALIKIYGGWIGAAMIVMINAYLVTTGATIQGLLVKLPDFLLQIVTNSDNQAALGISVGRIIQGTAGYIFLQALIAYLSPSAGGGGGSRTIADDFNSMYTTGIAVATNFNPSLSIDPNVNPTIQVALRQAQVNGTKADVITKVSAIVRNATASTGHAMAQLSWFIGRVITIPFVRSNSLFISDTDAATGTVVAISPVSVNDVLPGTSAANGSNSNIIPEGKVESVILAIEGQIDNAFDAPAASIPDNVDFANNKMTVDEMNKLEEEGLTQDPDQDPDMNALEEELAPDQDQYMNGNAPASSFAAQLPSKSTITSKQALKIKTDKRTEAQKQERLTMFNLARNTKEKLNKVGGKKSRKRAKKSKKSSKKSKKSSKKSKKSSRKSKKKR